MAREHARVKLSIWEDDDFRGLTPEAQHLYLVLLTHPTLDYCGVVDWRPHKIAGFARRWTSNDVETAAKELAGRLYVVVDESTEEVLLRSFIRNDGLMEQPNLAVAMRKAHAAISSSVLRGVIVHELIRLHNERPDLKGWPRALDMLGKASVNPSGNPSFDPSGNPSDDPSIHPSVKAKPNPSDDPSDDPSPTTSPSPSPNSSSPSEPRKRGERLPDDWTPGPELIDWQRREGITDETARRQLPVFRDYWAAVVGDKGRKLDWDATWRNWLRREHDTAARTGRPGQPAKTFDEFA